MPMKECFYESYEACFRSLTKMGKDPEDVTFSLDHEKQHFEKAVQLGYAPKYGVRMVLDFPPIIEHYFIGFEDKEPSGQDMIDIFLAPDEPGKNDVEMAEKIRKELAGKS